MAEACPDKFTFEKLGPSDDSRLGPLPFPIGGNDMHDPTWELTGKQFGGAHERHGYVGGLHRTTAMRLLGAVVYAARLDDGSIKIGWTERFDLRLHWLKHHAKQNVELLAFMPGTYDDEQAIHAELIDHRHHGHEYYHPTTEVLTVVNDMRAALKLPSLAA